MDFERAEEEERKRRDGGEDKEGKRERKREGGKDGKEREGEGLETENGWKEEGERRRKKGKRRREKWRKNRKIITLNPLPYGIRPRSQNVASTDIIVLHHLCFCDHLRVPLTKVLLLSSLQTQPWGGGGEERVMRRDS